MSDQLTNPYTPQPARILSIRQETGIDFTYRLAWPNQPQPGQFFEVSIPRLGEAPISVSSFGAGFIEMTIRKVGRVTEGIFAMKPGNELLLRGPYGQGFPIGQFQGRHLIIAAGGTGLAPVRSIIHHFVQHLDQLRQLDVMLGFKSPSDILFREEIDAWSTQINAQVTVDRSEDGWNGHVGVITTLVSELKLADLANVEAVVVGPPMMMKFTVLALLNLGIDESRIWVSYERRMSCGIGKCGHCKINDQYVCLDGPVFNFSKANWLID